MFRQCNEDILSTARKVPARRKGRGPIYMYVDMDSGVFQACRPYAGFRHPRGLTFVELLLAMTIMAMVVGTLAGLAHTAEQSFEYCEGYGAATQHAQVALDRITRAIYGATANEQFPGCIVVAETVNSWRYSDTLVVWHPSGAAANPSGLPLYCELVIYCPRPNYPNQLVEITAPNDTRTVPAVTDTATWLSQIAAIKTNSQSNIVTLTGLLRSCPIASATGSALRGAVRFETRLRPSQDDWNNFKNNTVNWKDMPWPQGFYGWQMGQRQVWVRMELQLIPQAPNGSANSANQIPVPFFGSASLYYQMHRQ
jgi:Prokaryotic N-terminal methylation motif